VLPAAAGVGERAVESFREILTQKVGRRRLQRPPVLHYGFQAECIIGAAAQLPSQHSASAGQAKRSHLKRSVALFVPE
jgi:hypothetical protein